MDGKPWYKSKTMLGLALTAVGVVLGVADPEAFSAELTEAIVRVFEIVGLAIAAYGRKVAKGPLTAS